MRGNKRKGGGKRNGREVSLVDRSREEGAISKRQNRFCRALYRSLDRKRTSLPNKKKKQRRTDVRGGLKKVTKDECCGSRSNRRDTREKEAIMVRRAKTSSFISRFLRPRQFYVIINEYETDRPQALGYSQATRYLYLNPSSIPCCTLVFV